MTDLTLNEVESIFHLKKVTPKNEQPGDKWDLEPYNPDTLPHPEDYSEFFAFLRESPPLLHIDCLLIHLTRESA